MVDALGLCGQFVDDGGITGALAALLTLEIAVFAATRSRFLQLLRPSAWSLVPFSGSPPPTAQGGGGGAAPSFSKCPQAFADAYKRFLSTRSELISQRLNVFLGAR